ncbi:hypothetical protein FHS76_001027 [Ochrobactrum daejeonense]|uniref:Uncharacterized protein n=1 Tax=Brucella daejeonensis TaxID=659015 RepID=A0A7W9AV57_9HYPH|nr:hypothetical protein [Brucella daejeonensis]MBB5701178.1 hypothetical protein [Brucella daejeonensis]
MKALVYEGPGRKSLQDRDIPIIIAATDAIVNIANAARTNALKVIIETAATGQLAGMWCGSVYSGSCPAMPGPTTPDDRRA